MKIRVNGLLCALALMAVVQGAVAAGDPQAGAGKVTVCAACHGADGNAQIAGYPSIAGLGENYLLKQLRDMRAWDLETDPVLKPRTGRPVLEMTGMLRNLSDQDLQDIAAYYDQQTLQIAGAQEMEVQIYTGEKVDALELGERLWRGGNLETGVPACAGCHSPSGQGNDAAGFPRLAGQSADYVATQLRAFRAGDRINDGEPMMMRLVTRRMSDPEIEAVANFIAGLH